MNKWLLTIAYCFRASFPRVGLGKIDKGSLVLPDVLCWGNYRLMLVATGSCVRCRFGFGLLKFSLIPFVCQSVDGIDIAESGTDVVLPTLFLVTFNRKCRQVQTLRITIRINSSLWIRVLGIVVAGELLALEFARWDSILMFWFDRNYVLKLRQQPKHSRMCGFGEKVDRRPLDPPPIIVCTWSSCTPQRACWCAIH